MTGDDPIKIPSQDRSPDGLDGKKVSDLITPETTINASGEVVGTLKWVTDVKDYRDGITEGHFLPIAFDDEYADQVKLSKRDGVYRGESADQEWTVYVPNEDTTFTFETKDDGHVFQTLTFKKATFEVGPATVTPTTGGTTRYSVDVANLQQDIQIKGEAISGTLKKVSSYDGFGDADAKNPGHYLALDIKAPDDVTVTTAVEGGSGKYVDVTRDKYCVYRIKQTSQKIKIKAQKGKQVVEKIYDLTGLKLNDEG